jgi:hypothetical protein
MRRKVLQNVEHGLNKTYSKGCRCFSCTKAHNDIDKKYRGKSNQNFNFGSMDLFRRKT